MRTELWDQFDDLVGAAPRQLATVTAHNPDGTSSLTTYDGRQMRAMGQNSTVIPYNVWVRGGRVLELAPSLSLVEVEV